MNALTKIVAAAGAPLDHGGRPGAPHGEETLDIGLMRLCGREIAVPALHVREVVPRPAVLQPSFSGASGSIVIRGAVIPVLDLKPLLGFEPHGDGEQVVVVLREGESLVGLLMDSVSGLARIPASKVQQALFRDGGARQLVSKSILIGETVVGLIDPAAVFALPNVPHAREGVAGARASGGGKRRSIVLLGVAGSEIGLDASRVVATVPNAAVRPSPIPSATWVGVVDYLGQEIPVVDDLALLGLSGRAGETGAEPVVVLRVDGDHMLGLKIDRVRRILHVAEEAVRPLPPAMAQRLSLFCGAVADPDGRESLLLDQDALVRSESLRMIGELSRMKGTQAPEPSAGAVQPRAAGKPASRRAAGSVKPFLIFRAGGKQSACDLTSVKQIIPVPQSRTRLEMPGVALQGLASYDGQPLPLVDLGWDGTARDIDSAEAAVLVARIDGAFIGFIVDGLEIVARAVPQARPAARPKASEASPGSFIEARIDGEARAITVCDLAAEARRLTAATNLEAA